MACLMGILLSCIALYAKSNALGSIFAIPCDTNKQDSPRETAIFQNPVVIRNDSDFISQGWPGSGTKNDPYRLGNILLTTEGKCIDVANTTSHFKIESCILTAGTEMSLGIAVRFVNVSNALIENSSLLSNYWSIVILNSKECQVNACNIAGEDASIVIENSSNCSILENSIRDYLGDGIHISNSNRTRVISNDVKGFNSESQEGIVIGTLSRDCTIANNTISNHYSCGIDLVKAIGTLVTGNNISRSFRAILLENSTSAIIHSNKLMDNQYGLLILSESSNNTIYHNHFANNSIHNAIDDGLSNTWDDGVAVGNWWDDYNGFGFYVISGESASVDTHPLPANPAFMYGRNSLLLFSLLIGFILVGAKHHSKEK